ncbi:MAG TPA: hypothetical protein VM681_10480 [Candidatus Thermoplasmatota archaeon]|nr:hypothetical protein [Candidatus Thermoplasmatota archaeon]
MTEALSLDGHPMQPPPGPSPPSPRVRSISTLATTMSLIRSAPTHIGGAYRTRDGTIPPVFGN